MNWLRDIWQGVQNLDDYFGLIWRDRDWDHSFLLALMEFKLRRMSKHIGGRGVHVSAKLDARRMLNAAEACRRIHADEYCDAEYEALMAKYGYRPDGDFLAWLNRHTSSEERAEYRAIFDRNETAIHKDLTLLADLLREHLREWWD
jgi:hypothetical protein